MYQQIKKVEYMEDVEEFKKYAHQMVEWMGDYMQNVSDYPVKSKVKPGEILNSLPITAPLKGEGMDEIFKDFEEKIMSGVTHWQHPNFFAYFPANNSFPSVLAEMLTATLGLQCMIWDTSPAAAELEEKVMNWLRDMLTLPAHFEGVIQDSASTATLTAILTAREVATKFNSNAKGLNGEVLKVYCSTEAHSSIEKAVKIAGIGAENLTKIPVDSSFALIPERLEEQIKIDIEKGFKPTCVIAALGTTGTTAVDPLDDIVSICKKYNVWLHIDAAYAGTVLFLDEYRHLIKGIEKVDSFVFNPHKWMFTNFDCSAYFVKDKQNLIKTFEILPEYLKTNSRGAVNDYRDWGVPLGRRFRALKLWFVLRSFGVEKIKAKLREHIRLAKLLEQWIVESKDFEIMAAVNFNLVCFRFKPTGFNDAELNTINTRLLQKLNESGLVYLTHTTIGGRYILRVVIAQTSVTESNVASLWDLVTGEASCMV